jgi:hypothetical protein
MRALRILLGLGILLAAATAEAFVGPALPCGYRHRLLPAHCRLPSMSLQGNEKVVVYAGEGPPTDIGRRPSFIDAHWSLRWREGQGD